MEEAVTPLPRPETTPPETTTYFMTFDRRRARASASAAADERSTARGAAMGVCDGTLHRTFGTYTVDMERECVGGGGGCENM